jgi:hypothetical protein
MVNFIQLTKWYNDLILLSSYYLHWCTVVGNPGGAGSWVFWQILLRGVLGIVRKSVGGGVVFISFLCGSFQKIFIGGTWGAPPPAPSLCASMATSFTLIVVCDCYLSKFYHLVIWFSIWKGLTVVKVERMLVQNFLELFVFWKCQLKLMFLILLFPVLTFSKINFKLETCLQLYCFLLTFQQMLKAWKLMVWLDGSVWFDGLIKHYLI